LSKDRVPIKGLKDERRSVYDEIKGMSPEAQVIEIQRPRVRTGETDNAEGKKLETRTGHLMSDGDGNFPFGSLNQWEIEVLDTEMARSDFQAWYRNPSINFRRRSPSPPLAQTATRLYMADFIYRIHICFASLDICSV